MKKCVFFNKSHRKCRYSSILSEKMDLFTGNLVVGFFGTIIIVVATLYIYLKYVAFNYWSSRGIPQVEPTVPVGNMWPVLTEKVSMGEAFSEAYLKFKEHPVCGYYGFHNPILIVNDPDLIRFVLTKEFGSFHDRGVYCNEEIDKMNGHLFSLPGTKWKNLRLKLTPTFTSGKIKQMISTVKECGDELANYMADAAKNEELVEVKDIVARYSTDVIASIAFGIQCNSLRNPNSEFRKWGMKVFQNRPFVNTIAALCPSLLTLFRVKLTPEEITKFFVRIFTEAVEYRKANKIVRNDFLELLMELMDNDRIEDNESKKESEGTKGKISLNEGVAQAFIFWIAGFETSSSTVTHCLYELSIHQDVQDQLANEITTILEEYNGITYESVQKMPYLHKVFSETLRKYPSIPILNRICTKDVHLPGTNLHLKSGTQVVIPVLGLQRNPDIYPDPDEFDPERFSEENNAKRHHYTYLPFGEGPRNCIGMRFGIVQTKIALICLLSKYRFTPGPNLERPLIMATGILLNAAKNGVILRIHDRHEKSPIA